ncbi:MAG: RNA polymerase sporulation sigma factor SigK [Bacillota bacterium]|nr:RNA polymerase sporulation sigma factor SigK [Bacillota bacterium]
MSSVGALVFLTFLLEGLVFLVSYLANEGVFPQPLSEEEEEACLKRMEEGDEEARNLLIERNLRLVAHIVKKFEHTGYDNEDLISIGTIGLIKAIDTFNRHRKTRLATYAAHCIENEILMCLRAGKKARGEVFLSEPVGADREGNEITWLDVLGTEGDVVAESVESRAEQSDLHAKLKVLTGRERQVLELRYGLRNGVRQTQREVSRLLGISRSYVSRIEKKALDKLYKEMYSEGYH